MLSPEHLGRPGKCLCPGTTIAILPTPNQCLGLDIHCRHLPPCPFAVRPPSLLQLDSPQPPARPDRAPLLVFFGDSVRGPRRGMSRRWASRRTREVRNDVVGGPCVFALRHHPPDPTAPPGHRSAGLRRVEVPGKLVRCVIGCEGGCSMSGRTGGGVRVLS